MIDHLSNRLFKKGYTCYRSSNKQQKTIKKLYRRFSKQWDTIHRNEQYYKDEFNE